MGLQDALLRAGTVEEFLEEVASLAAPIADEGPICVLALPGQGRRAVATACTEDVAAEAVRAARSGQDRCLVERRFRCLELPLVRRVAAGFGVFSGIGAARLGDFVLAVSETAACAVCHGAATAVLRLWHDGTSVCCEVRGEPGPGAGPLPVQVDSAQAMRLSLLHRVCDYVCVEADSSGVTVRVAMSLTAPPLPG
ncbi:MAG TPA: hypothetical protein VMG38_18705 [Trebonia sp.]|nr:hypothetical protein [Trebonia sp.]